MYTANGVREDYCSGLRRAFEDNTHISVKSGPGDEYVWDTELAFLTKPVRDAVYQSESVVPRFSRSFDCGSDDNSSTVCACKGAQYFSNSSIACTRSVRLLQV